jgi:hypothetical protein
MDQRVRASRVELSAQGISEYGERKKQLAALLQKIL